MTFALILSGFPARAQQPQGRLTLLQEVVVNTPMVHVSDLLPYSAGPAEFSEARKISLGRAPQPGSFRVLRAAAIEEAIAGKLHAAAPPAVTVRRGGWPLAADRVRAAFDTSVRGLPLGVSLSLPQGVVTRTSNPRLEVLSVRPGWNSDSSIARLRCADRNDCGTFLVVIEAPQLGTALRKLERRDSSIAPLVRSGKKALLVIAGDGMKITLPVVPLKGGSLGDTVRVLDPQAHRVRYAQVAGENLLQSNPGAGR